MLVVNPDIRFLQPDALAQLLAVLAEQPDLGAVAPAIRTEDGTLEHLGSIADVDRARVHHVETFVAVNCAAADGPRVDRRRGDPVPAGGAQGGRRFDERFFLFQEEVDCALRARGPPAGGVALSGRAEVGHRRSSSFGSSQKGVVLLTGATSISSARSTRGSRVVWRVRWLAALLGFARRRRHLRSGASARALRGGLDALRGRWGAGPDDQAATAA